MACRSLAYFLVAVALTGCGSSAGQPQKTPVPVVPAPTGPSVENVDYANWVQFKVGTTVKVKSVTARGKAETISIETYVLVEVNEKELVVTRQNTTERNDGSYKAVNLPEQRRYNKSFALPDGMTAEDFQKPALKAKLVREEVVTAAGKSYPAKVYEWKDSTEGGAMNVTVWLSNELPGRVVKQVMTVAALETTTTDEVIEVVLK
jgi:hypothetical protein